MFEHLHEKAGGSIIIISHQERILNIADKVIVLADGKIANIGSKEEVLPGLLLNGPGCEKLTEKF